MNNIIISWLIYLNSLCLIYYNVMNFTISYTLECYYRVFIFAIAGATAHMTATQKSAAVGNMG